MVADAHFVGTDFLYSSRGASVSSGVTLGCGNTLKGDAFIIHNVSFVWTRERGEVPQPVTYRP